MAMPANSSDTFAASQSTPGPGLARIVRIAVTGNVPVASFAASRQRCRMQKRRRPDAGRGPRTIPCTAALNPDTSANVLQPPRRDTCEGGKQPLSYRDPSRCNFTLPASKNKILSPSAPSFLAWLRPVYSALRFSHSIRISLEGRDESPIQTPGMPSQYGATLRANRRRPKRVFYHHEGSGQTSALAGRKRRALRLRLRPPRPGRRG